MHIGLGVGYLSTTLRFDDDRQADVEMTALSLSGALIMDDRWTARASVGALLDGMVQPTTGAAHDFEPGGLAALGVEYLARRIDGHAPSIDLSFLLSGTWAETVDPNSGARASYFATDARLGARATWRLGSSTYPYVAARIFGGPVNWQWAGEDVVGNDIHHYQLAMGAAVQFGSVAVFVEWAGLGERGAGAGLGTAW